MDDYGSSDDEYSYEDYHEDVDDQDHYDDFDYETFDSTSASESIKIITKESLLAAQSKELRQVVDLVSVKEQHARAVLVHYRWDVEKVVSVLVERGKDELLSAAGVRVLEGRDEIPSGEAACGVCLEDVSSDNVTAMDCGHAFCDACWTRHFAVKIQEGQSRRIGCMAHRCNAICDESKVRALVGAGDAALAEKFDRSLLESYIEDNEKVKWCPSAPHCGNAIRCSDGRLREVECACGLAFCFGCLSEPHSPCSCRMWELWLSKCRNESETMNWITVHAKPCPKCHKMVEKNGGCNLVHCICRQTFCWLCGEATGPDHTYRHIEGHSCGRYAEDKKAKREMAKKYLYRYMHYHNRFKAHTDSLKLETKLREAIQARISMLEVRDSLAKDYSWLTNGLYRLSRSRRILSYTYPFAYYMFGEFAQELTETEKETKQNLFEDFQQQLEAKVESLSSCLEEHMETYSDDQVMEARMKIINLDVLVDKRCRQLYDCIQNDLLGSLRSAPSIAAYNSDGADKASQLGAST